MKHCLNEVSSHILHPNAVSLLFDVQVLTKQEDVYIEQVIGWNKSFFSHAGYEVISIE